MNQTASAEGKAKSKPTPEPAADDGPRAGEEVILDPAIEETKAKEGLIDQLRHQATHPDVQARDIPNSDILDALQTCKGLVYPALKRDRSNA